MSVWLCRRRGRLEVVAREAQETELLLFNDDAFDIEVDNVPADFDRMTDDSCGSAGTTPLSPVFHNAMAVALAGGDDSDPALQDQPSLSPCLEPEVDAILAQADRLMNTSRGNGQTG